MVFPSVSLSRRLFHIHLIFLIGAAAAFPAAAAAFEKWQAEKQFEITACDGSAFNQPSDVAIFEGRIYVLDSVNNRICWFDSRGRQLGAVTGAGEASLTGALGITHDSRGRFFVADSKRGRILAFTGVQKPTVFLTLIEAEKQEASADPTGVLYFNDRLFIADNDGHKIRVYQADGKKEGDWGGLGDMSGMFKNPFRLAVDPKGRIGVTDVLNGRIQFFTPKGEHLGNLGGLGTVSGTLFRPGGFDIDAAGNIYVADAYFGVIQVFDLSGRLIAVLHERSGSPLVLKSPMALKVVRDALTVVEMSADKVSVYSIKKQ